MNERDDIPHGARNMDPDACVAHGGHCPAYRRGRPQADIAWGEPIIGGQS